MKNSPCIRLYDKNIISRKLNFFNSILSIKIKKYFLVHLKIRVSILVKKIVRPTPLKYMDRIIHIITHYCIFM